MNDYDLIEWSDTMLTGVDEIDLQHKELLSFLNGWLVNHILNIDKHLGGVILSKRT